MHIEIKYWYLFSALFQTTFFPSISLLLYLTPNFDIIPKNKAVCP